MGQHRFQFLVWPFPIIEDGLLKKKQLRPKKWLPSPNYGYCPASFKYSHCVIMLLMRFANTQAHNF